MSSHSRIEERAKLDMLDEKSDDVSDSPPPTSGTRIVHANAPEKNSQFVDNRICNSKYTWYNFLPKNLLEQFSLHINRYFLFIAILQLFPAITPVNPITTWAPLAVVFLIAAFKEGFDDWHRHKEDEKANGKEFRVFRNGVINRIPSWQICVGDILLLEEGEEIPCDLLLLKSINADGSVFLKTVNLDGETMLKSRSALPETAKLEKYEAERFSGVCLCSEPNAEVYKFDAQLWLTSSHSKDVPRGPPLSVNSDQLLQQGCSLANTVWCYGLVVYTGNETKFGKNKSPPPSKLTKVDNFINTIAVYIFLTQLGLVVVFGLVGDVWYYVTSQFHWYLEVTTDVWYSWLIIPLRFLLLNSTMIPISLKVTLDFCKMIYSQFIAYDIAMIPSPQSSPDSFLSHMEGEDYSQMGAYVKNTSISEDLGQIDYILTDKTGTLTQNVMVFKSCSINGRTYAEEACIPNGELTQLASNRSSPELELLLHFVLNSTVLPVPKAHNEIIYQSASPDEAALVHAAAQHGVRLKERVGKEVLVEVLGREEWYLIEEELKFTSDRKRMSVIVRKKQAGSNQWRLYIKGADDVIMQRLIDNKSQADVARLTMADLETFASQGLRTLCFAYRDLNEDEVTSWQQEHSKAKRQIVRREEELSRVYDLLEKDFMIQGCSAIEDKLQEAVPHTIEVLRDAGIKFWMLTGDKYSTALQIATACNLKSSNKKTLLCNIEGKTENEVGRNLDLLFDQANNQSLQDAEEKSREKSNLEVVVVVRGSVLEMALTYHQPRFLELCLLAHTVICCRVSPAQKAQLVHLVRSAGKRTLAIGDGGNDVAMIQQANVGVGIRGKEGLQAARAADYAISYFGAIKRLILVHGRYSYLRTALVAQYSFYKSFLFCCIQIFYGFYSAFSGNTLFNSLCITAYNAVLFIPIVSFVFDKDVPFKNVLDNPKLYAESRLGRPFSLLTMWRWNVRAFLQALIIFFFSIGTYGLSYHFHSAGYSADWQVLGLFAFASYLWLQAVTMTMLLHTLTWINIITIWGMHFFTLILLVFINEFMAFNSIEGYGSANMAFRDSVFWLHSLLTTITCILPVLFMQGYKIQMARIAELQAKNQDKHGSRCSCSSCSAVVRVPLLSNVTDLDLESIPLDASASVRIDDASPLADLSRVASSLSESPLRISRRRV